MSKLSIYLSVLFFVLISGAYVIGWFPKALLLGYIGLSIITFIIYALDKAKARRNSWRTSESTLHLLALLGGWPGAAFAQQFLRHKSSKRVFRRVYWVTVIVNLACLFFLHNKGVFYSQEIQSVFKELTSSIF